MNNKIKLGAVLYIVLVVGLAVYIANGRVVRQLPFYDGEVDGSAFCEGGLTPKPSLCANYINNGLERLSVAQNSGLQVTSSGYDLQWAPNKAQRTQYMSVLQGGIEYERAD